MPTDTSAEDVLQLLQDGELEVEGRLTDASNTVLRVWAELSGSRIPAVYKPVRGERPLWDFPDGTLAARERAAYLVSVAGGWSCIPPTVLRDGPFGEGSVQQWVGALDEREDPDLLRVDPPRGVPSGYLPVVGLSDEDDAPLVVSHASDEQLRDIALLDIVLNNADRKGSALIPEADRLYAVDHGLTLHEEDKLRTVLWGFAGSRLRTDEVQRVSELQDAVAGTLGQQLRELVTRAELEALEARIAILLRQARFPEPPDHRHPLPWPLW